MILSLYSALVRLHLEYWVQFCASQYKRDVDILERVRQRVMTVAMGLKLLSYAGRLAELAYQAPGDDYEHVQIPEGREQRGQSQALSSGALCQDKRQSAQTGIQEVLSKCQAALLCSAGDVALVQIAERGCGVLEI